MDYNQIYHAVASAMEKALEPLHAQLNALIETEIKPIEKPQTTPNTEPQQEEIAYFKELGERMTQRDAIKHGNVNPVNWEFLAKKRFGSDYKIY